MSGRSQRSPHDSTHAAALPQHRGDAASLAETWETTCSRLLTTSRGYATVWPKVPAKAPQASRVTTLRSRSSVKSALDAPREWSTHESIIWIQGS